jgi:hypothetical protein
MHQTSSNTVEMMSYAWNPLKSTEIHWNPPGIPGIPGVRGVRPEYVGDCKTLEDIRMNSLPLAVG